MCTDINGIILIEKIGFEFLKRAATSEMKLKYIYT